MNKTVFITGITGNQGGAVARHLLHQGHTVIGLTRNANSKKAIELKANGAQLIEGNLYEPESYKADLQSVDSIFLVQALQKKAREIEQGKRFIDIIDPKNNIHLIYASVLGADLNTGVPHFESKYELEKYIQSKNLSHTILRSASFYENHLFPRVANDIKKGKYISPLKSTCKQQMIGVDDIGKIAVQVLANREKYDGKILPIATDEWQVGAIPEIFSKALNKKVIYKKLPGFITRLVMGRDLHRMFTYMNTNDFSIIENVDAVRNEFNIQGNFKSWVLDNF